MPRYSPEQRGLCITNIISYKQCLRYSPEQRGLNQMKKTYIVPARGIAPRSADQSILLSGCRVSPIARSSVGLTPSAIGLGLQALGALTLSSNLSLTLSSVISLAVSSIVSSTISSPLLITCRGCVSSLPLCIIVALISICQRTLSARQ